MKGKLGFNYCRLHGSEKRSFFFEGTFRTSGTTGKRSIHEGQIKFTSERLGSLGFISELARKLWHVLVLYLFFSSLVVSSRGSFFSKQ